jgi:hypothetical protein
MYSFWHDLSIGWRCGTMRAVRKDVPVALMKEQLSTEKTVIRALSLHVVRSVARQHGGTLLKELGTNTVAVLVPSVSRAECTREITKQLDAMREYLYTVMLACSCGKVVVLISNN